MTSKIPQPCPKCGMNRWKTVTKKQSWICRNCDYVRDSKSNATEEVTPKAKARMKK